MRDQTDEESNSDGNKEIRKISKRQKRAVKKISMKKMPKRESLQGGKIPRETWNSW